MSAATLLHPLRLTLIGSGQVATHLGLAFEQAGHRVQLIYSKRLAHAKILAGQLTNAQATDHLDFREQPACDLYLVSISDAAVAAVMAAAHFPEGSRVAHTAGSLPVSVLEGHAFRGQVGVFYPVQTFSRHYPVNIAQTPIVLEAAWPELASLLEQLATSISRQVHFMTGSERKQLHLAAVFACNFTNHLLGISRELLNSRQLDSHLLEPLIKSTIEKSFAADPFRVQTGPAVRGDSNIIQEHLHLLALQPLYQQIYQLLSSSIQEKK